MALVEYIFGVGSMSGSVLLKVGSFSSMFNWCYEVMFFSLCVWFKTRLPGMCVVCMQFLFCNNTERKFRSC